LTMTCLRRQATFRDQTDGTLPSRDHFIEIGNVANTLKSANEPVSRKFVEVIIWDEAVCLLPNRDRFAKIDKELKPMMNEDSKAIENLGFVSWVLWLSVEP
jgi:hypothetical protein